MRPEIKRKQKLFALKEITIGALYPKACPGCGKLLDRKKVIKAIFDPVLLKKENPFICRECYVKLKFADGQNRCFKCSRPMEEEDEVLCRDCREKEREFAWGRAMLLHQGIAKEMIYSVKYGRVRDNCDFLGLEMARRMRQEIMFMNAECLVPVPLHAKRLRERGFNQAGVLAERISFFYELLEGKTLKVDENFIKRRGSTGRLKTMSGQQRRENLRGVFEVPVKMTKYDKVIVVDDIFTTGSTINECTKTLKKAGVSVVYFLSATIGS